MEGKQPLGIVRKVLREAQNAALRKDPYVHLLFRVHVQKLFQVRPVEALELLLVHHRVRKHQYGRVEAVHVVRALGLAYLGVDGLHAFLLPALYESVQKIAASAHGYRQLLNAQKVAHKRFHGGYHGALHGVIGRQPRQPVLIHHLGHVQHELCVLDVLGEGLLPDLRGLLLPGLAVLLRQDHFPSVAGGVVQVLLQRLHRAVRVVVDAHHLFVVIIIAAFPERLGDVELVAYAYVQYRIHRVFVQEMQHAFFHDFEVGHGLVQGVPRVEDFPGDHIREVRYAVGPAEVRGVPEQLYSLCF